METENLQGAQSVMASIAGAQKIVEGPVEFLRLKAKKKYGQNPADYPSELRGRPRQVA